ncbi:hypothetical protein N7512_003991 [Penicillium capsulatum]|nr:hypothetical protein N7512_003991 [Penicillium capsulatum]
MHLDLPFLLALAGTASSALVQTAQVLPSDTALLAAPNALIQPNVYSPLATSSARGVPHLRSRRKQQRVLCDHNAPKHGTKDEKHRVTPVDLKDNFDWVYNWTSLGDSYTAAPGAGKRISDDEDDKCLQFHGSYASILNQICSSREGDGRKWNFIACSGDTTKEIRQQVAWLSKQSQDLVTLTAGGNDAFLSDILGACIYAVLDNKLCEKSQKRSKDVIDSILKTNITTVLNELHPKMAEGGIVVYSLYSRFFNETTTHCSSKSMNLMSDSSLGTWTRKLREELNQLVLDANKQIKLAIEEVRDKKKMRIEIVEPDEYIGAIHGRMCEDGQSDDYNNAKNGNMAFTMLDFNSHTPTKKVRSIEDEKESLRYHSLSLLPKRNVVESLKARGLGDFWTGLTDGSKVKDWVKKKLTTLELMSSFHLNLVGNTIVAGLVLQAIENARRKLAEEERDRKCMWPPVTDARCMRRELGAPQRKDDGEPDVTTAVKAFCKKYKGHRPNNGTGTFSLNPHLPLLKIHGTALTGLVDGYSSGYPVRERTSYWYYSFWIASDYNPPRKPQFSKSFFRTCEPDPIEEDLCVHLLLGGMNFCDPNSGLTHGTEIEDGCSKFVRPSGISGRFLRR